METAVSTAVPEWKRALIRAREQRDIEQRKQSEHTQAENLAQKYAHLPPWKRDLVIKKEREQLAKKTSSQSTQGRRPSRLDDGIGKKFQELIINKAPTEQTSTRNLVKETPGQSRTVQIAASPSSQPEKSQTISPVTTQPLTRSSSDTEKQAFVQQDLPTRRTSVSDLRSKFMSGSDSNGSSKPAFILRRTKKSGQEPSSAKEDADATGAGRADAPRRQRSTSPTSRGRGHEGAEDRREGREDSRSTDGSRLGRRSSSKEIRGFTLVAPAPVTIPEEASTGAVSTARDAAVAREKDAAMQRQQQDAEQKRQQQEAEEEARVEREATRRRQEAEEREEREQERQQRQADQERKEREEHEEREEREKHERQTRMERERKEREEREEREAQERKEREERQRQEAQERRRRLEEQERAQQEAERAEQERRDAAEKKRKQLEGATESSTATEQRAGAAVRTSLIMADGADTGSSTTDDDATPPTPTAPPADETPQQARLRRMAERRARVEAKRRAAEAAKSAGDTAPAAAAATEPTTPTVSFEEAERQRREQEEKEREEAEIAARRAQWAAKSKDKAAETDKRLAEEDAKRKAAEAKAAAEAKQAEEQEQQRRVAEKSWPRGVLSDGKPKAMKRKISWSDEVGKLPLERLAPVAYVSDTEGDDDDDDSVRRSSRDDDEEEEDDDGLSTPVHTTVAKRHTVAKAPSLVVPTGPKVPSVRPVSCFLWTSGSLPSPAILLLYSYTPSVSLPYPSPVTFRRLSSVLSPLPQLLFVRKSCTLGLVTHPVRCDTI
eukprot:m.1387083 g.1387083  ORF g.1387083 m.1387083 type:complete len:784 (-) comp24979_c0_seq8:112-2463(-)